MQQSLANIVLQFYSWLKKLFQSDVIQKEIVCLATSRKYFGYCVAGKEISTEQWIRPISREKNGQLFQRYVRYQDGSLPEMLDVIEIRLAGKATHSYQQENYFIKNKRWIKRRVLPASELSNLCDDPPCLWINGYSSFNGLNDRVPQKVADEHLAASLFLIKPENLSMMVVTGYHSEKKLRAKFLFKGTIYNLAVTDPVSEQKYLIKDIGEYHIENKELFLCISLGEPYNGYCYKLIAGIIAA